jgi:uncharacterized cupredoxin-like copper-binding protein
MGTGTRRSATIVVSLALGLGFVACGGDDDDEDTTSASEESASAEEVTVTTGDTADGFSWEVEPTATADTKTIEYVNESEEGHAFIFARINEGYTVEEAYELQGRKGSATTVAESDEKTSPGPGETVTIEVTEPIEPGNYAMLCPIPGHYQQGQLEEFEIQ